jgi:predicted signal transduction protein with EAL and GGDEF domain
MRYADGYGEEGFLGYERAIVVPLSDRIARLELTGTRPDYGKAAAGLSSEIRTEDMLGCFGGDEFVVLQFGLMQPGGAAHLADRLKAILDEPYDMDGTPVRCGTSIGISIAPTDAKEWGALLTCAYAALYKAKAAGRNTVCLFEAGMAAVVRERRMMEVELRRALTHAHSIWPISPSSAFMTGV